MLLLSEFQVFLTTCRLISWLDEECVRLKAAQDPSVEFKILDRHVQGVQADGLDIPLYPLYRHRAVDTACAAGHVVNVYGLMAKLGHAANRDSAVRALAHRVRLIAVVLVVYQSRERAGVVLGLVDLQVGLGRLQVGDRPFGLRRVAGVLDRTVVNTLEERFPGGLRQPNLLAGVDVGEHPDDRTAVAGRVRVALGAVFLACNLAEPLEALPRYENVPGDQGDAAGTAQASDVPVVDDLQVAHGHDRRDRLDLARRVDRRRREELPLAVPGAAVEPPLAGNHSAVL